MTNIEKLIELFLSLPPFLLGWIVGAFGYLAICCIVDEITVWRIGNDPAYREKRERDYVKKYGPR